MTIFYHRQGLPTNSKRRIQLQLAVNRQDCAKEIEWAHVHKSVLWIWRKKLSKWQVFVVNESRTWKCFHEFWFGESDSLKQSMYRLHSGKQRHLWGSWSLVDSLAYYLIDDQQATLHVSNLWSLYITNIASTSKAALHKLPGKSSSMCLSALLVNECFQEENQVEIKCLSCLFCLSSLSSLSTQSHM